MTTAFVHGPGAPPAGHQRAAVDLYWLPLGAGGRCVRLNGRLYETLAARLQRRARRDLYHSGLEVHLDAARYVIEMAPVWNERCGQRGVVAEGPVGSRRAGRLRLFRYEVRCSRDGRIPDIEEAIDSPRRLSGDPACARRILDLAPQVPTLVWGRDAFDCGDMWNSNSVVAWLLAQGGIATGSIAPPPGGRAPGWDAGLVAAHRTASSAPRGRPASQQAAV